MTVLKSNPGTAPPPAHAHRRPKRGPEPAGSRLPVSFIAVLAALGVLVVSAAYTYGRLGNSASPWPDRAYWLGQILIVAPAAVRLFSRERVSSAATAGLVLVLTLAQYLVQICYSPTSFTFPDELWHWRSTVDLINTGKLFTVNYALPVGPRYPGLEEVTTAFANVTRLPLFTSGLIIAGVAHVIFVLVLYLIFSAVTRSHRLAGIAAVIYLSTPDLSSFDSMYIYQTLAVAFLALALLAAWRATEDAAGFRGLAIAILMIVATVVTHHATSYVLVAALGLLALAAAVSRRRRSTARLAVLAVIGAATIAAWIYFVAPGTISYFAPTGQAIAQGLRHVSSAGSAPAATSPAAPISDQAIGILSVIVISILLPFGWLRIWRQARDQPWIVAMAIGSTSWYVIVVVRFAVANGSELAGRASTFVYIPAALVVAIAISRPVFVTGTVRNTVAVAAAIATALVLVFDGLINGWPPFWERLPGGYQASGFERSVSPEGIAASEWALAVLGPGNRFAADQGNYPMMASYGYQNPIRNIAYLYTSSQFSASDAQKAGAQQIHYLLVDLRLSELLPASGRYFPIDPNSGRYKHPLARADLTKFNRVPGIARIYDSGNIVIYNLQGF